MERKVHNKVKAFIKENDLIQEGDELVLGVSGGADSMMMLDYFFTHRLEYGISLKVAHVHHGLREEAELDAQLVEETCKQWEIPFFRHDCNIRKIANDKKISEEEAGRLERYNFFISLLSQNGKIVTAHNMNDQAETMLMRFIRGTDIRGLGGIMPKRENIIRPLLCLNREEIEAYCQERGVPFRHDATNFKPIYTRNKIRLNCIPYIKEELNPNIISVLGEHSRIYREENDFLDSYTRACFEECSHILEDEIVLKTEKLRSLHPYIQKRIFIIAIKKLIGDKNITVRHLEDCEKLLKLQSGKQLNLPNGLVVNKEQQGIILGREKKQKNYCYPLNLGVNIIKEAGLQIEITKIFLTDYMKKERINQKNENNYTKYIDYGKMRNGVQIRTRRPSDFIQLGNGTKKLKRLFIDDKISKALRDKMPLIADGEEIVWVIGNRLSMKYYVTDETKEILKIKVLKL